MKNSLKQFLNGVVLLMGLISFCPSASAKTPIDRIVAIADNEIITQSEIDRIIRSRKGASDSVKAAGDQRGILHQLIEERLILQQARRRGISITESELEFALKDIQNRNRLPDRETLKKAVARDHLSWDQYIENLKNQLTTLKLLNREVDTMVTLSDAVLQAYYRDHPDIFGLPDRVRLKQILLRIPDEATEADIKRIAEKAEKVFSEARSGTVFNQLVQEYSEGREKREEGDLGFFKRGTLSEKIDRVVFNLKEGEIAPPIQTHLGIHIFKIEAQEIGRLRPFETVEQKIKEKLIAEKTASLREKWVNDLWARSYIEIK